MNKLLRCLFAAVLLAAIVLPMGGCGIGSLGEGENQGNNQGNSGSGSQGSGQGGTGNQGQGSQGSGSQDGGEDGKYSEYSPLLQSVLNNSYYDDLYRRYKSGELAVTANRNDFGVNLLEAIPYEYLASKGEDIEGIKESSVGVSADLYVKNDEPNYLYSKSEIFYEDENKNVIIHQYLLKYPSDEQEIRDLIMLYNGRYYQGPIMFQQLASEREPETICEWSLTERANDEIIKSCNRKTTFIAEALNFSKIDSCAVKSLTPTTYMNENAYDITLYLYSDGRFLNYLPPVSAGHEFQVNAKLLNSVSRITFNNGVMDMENLNANPISVSSTPITYFYLDHGFKNFKDKL